MWHKIQEHLLALISGFGAAFGVITQYITQVNVWLQFLALAGSIIAAYYSIRNSKRKEKATNESSESNKGRSP